MHWCHQFWIGCLLALISTPTLFGQAPVAHPVKVEILEGVPDKQTWDLKDAKVTGSYTEPAFGFVFIPPKYSDKAHVLDRSSPFMLQARANLTFPKGKYQIIVRGRGAVRLYLDDKLLAQHGFPRVATNGHQPVVPLPKLPVAGIKPYGHGQRDKLITVELDGKDHEYRFEIMVAGKGLRPETGEPAVAIRKDKEDGFYLLSDSLEVPFTSAGWKQYVRSEEAYHIANNAAARQQVSKAERAYWDQRHELVRKIVTAQPAPVVPKIAAKLPVHNAIDQFLGAKLESEKGTPTALTSDEAFLRRVKLDTVGLIPTPEEIEAFRNDKSPDKRAKVIDRLLADPRWADHWVGYWQDVLAENPGLITPSLNNTGPFRWYLHAAFSDNLPMDRFVTDLILMEGSVNQGAPAAFGLATNNDVPMAAKAHVLGKAFLAVDMTCARCHDAPYHPYKQQQLFGMAAMLERKAVKVPGTSSVPMAKGARKPHVEVTLKAGSSVNPDWRLSELIPTKIPDGLLRNAKDEREKLAVLITSPHNTRFAKVLVNRVWQRYLGLGLITNPDDWSAAEASHPELLEYLARELMRHDYDLKHLARLILNSHGYQRQAIPMTELEGNRLFAGPVQRRMTAEQLVDSLFAAVGKEFDSEELTFDPEGKQTQRQCTNQGHPKRAWHFCTLNNERDRPALSLPIAQGYVDLLSAFGWRFSRPSPLTLREDALTPIESMTLANGQLMNRLIRLTDEAEITELSVQKLKLEELVQKTYLRILSRPATAGEMRMAVELLQPGYEQRLTGKPARPKEEYICIVTWANHLHPEATRLKMEATKLARAGDAPTPRLQEDWRMRMEDLVWSMLNSPEFVFVP
jgi:hypothetical protein